MLQDFSWNGFLLSYVSHCPYHSLFKQKILFPIQDVILPTIGTWWCAEGRPVCRLSLAASKPLMRFNYHHFSLSEQTVSASVCHHQIQWCNPWCVALQLWRSMYSGAELNRATGRARISDRQLRDLKTTRIELFWHVESVWNRISKISTKERKFVENSQLSPSRDKVQCTLDWTCFLSGILKTLLTAADETEIFLQMFRFVLMTVTWKGFTMCKEEKETKLDTTHWVSCHFYVVHLLIVFWHKWCD